MVWFHGGGYTSGDSSARLYGPEYLLDKDVILVTSNYRLGIFGFLTLGKVLFLRFSSHANLMSDLSGEVIYFTNLNYLRIL